MEEFSLNTAISTAAEDGETRPLPPAATAVAADRWCRPVLLAVATLRTELTTELTLSFSPTSSSSSSSSHSLSLKVTAYSSPPSVCSIRRFCRRYRPRSVARRVRVCSASSASSGVRPWRLCEDVEREDDDGRYEQEEVVDDSDVVFWLLVEQEEAPATG